MESDSPCDESFYYLGRHHQRGVTFAAKRPQSVRLLSVVLRKYCCLEGRNSNVDRRKTATFDRNTAHLRHGKNVKS